VLARGASAAGALGVVDRVGAHVHFGLLRRIVVGLGVHFAIGGVAVLLGALHV